MQVTWRNGNSHHVSASHAAYGTLRNMDVELRYRTELADEFIERIAQLNAQQWREVIAHHERDHAYYRLSVELVSEATQLLGPERVDQYEAALAARSARISEILECSRAELSPLVHTSAQSLAVAAMQALVMRDAKGMNAGAFGTLIAPFRPYIDVAELDRVAARRTTPPGSASQPPDRAPRTR